MHDSGMDWRPYDLSARGGSLLGQNDCRVIRPIFDELSEAIPGIILKAA